jgi:hypothetical protein
MIDDDELDRLIRAANPAPREHYLDVRARDLAVREGIIRGTRAAARPIARPRRRTWSGFAAAVAAVAAAVVVSVLVLTPAQQAVALTPPPLVYGNPQPLADVVAEARDALADGDGPAQERRVHSLNWGWSIDMGSERIEIVPQETTLEWGPDGAGTVTIVAGESFWDRDDRPDGVADSPYSPGEVIASFAQTPEQFNAPAALLTLSGSTPDDLWPVLNAYSADESSSSGELATAIVSLLGQWTLTDAQHATLIDLLAETGDVQVLGQTRDRLGREVVGLRVSDPARRDHAQTLLVSTDTGRIVGEETELLHPMDFIPAGVIGYTLWDIDEPARG